MSRYCNRPIGGLIMPPLPAIQEGRGMFPPIVITRAHRLATAKAPNLCKNMEGYGYQRFSKVLTYPQESVLQ